MDGGVRARHEPKNNIDATAVSLAARNDRTAIFRLLTAEPLGEPIAHYFDHFQVPELLADETLVVREDLRRLGLTNLPFE